MNAAPLLREVATSLRAARLEAVLIGNAAAALQGAPVTTVDFFFFRKTPRNVAKLKAFAGFLDATILRPYYPASTIDVGGVELLVASLDDVIRAPDGLFAHARRAGPIGALTCERCHS